MLSGCPALALMIFCADLKDFRSITRIIISLTQTTGVPLRAEIIPIKPDAGNAAVGKRIISLHRTFLKFNNKERNGNKTQQSD